MKLFRYRNDTDQTQSVWDDVINRNRVIVEPGEVVEVAKQLDDGFVFPRGPLTALTEDDSAPPPIVRRAIREVTPDNVPRPGLRLGKIGLESWRPEVRRNLEDPRKTEVGMKYDPPTGRE
jgi:hypothetical protein